MKSYCNNISHLKLSLIRKLNEEPCKKQIKEKSLGKVNCLRKRIEFKSHRRIKDHSRLKSTDLKQNNPNNSYNEIGIENIRFDWLHSSYRMCDAFIENKNITYPETAKLRMSRFW